VRVGSSSVQMVLATGSVSLSVRAESIFGVADRGDAHDTRAEANDDRLGCDGDSDGFNADSSTSDLSFARSPRPHAL